MVVEESFPDVLNILSLLMGDSVKYQMICLFSEEFAKNRRCFIVDTNINNIVIVIG
jgi:hypothetical protein